MRARNWCEALLETNLRKVNGVWLFHFEGDELKIATRRGETNVYEIEIPAEVVPYLEEYLTTWRPKLPRASEDRHVLLALRAGGGMLKPKDLYMKLKVHVYRHTKKRLYPHLLRTIFTSSMLSSGMDINSVAYGLNDNPATVLRAYNELQAGVHQQSLHDAYRRALNGNGTPP
jgi:site-specific recombinase XerD